MTNLSMAEQEVLIKEAASEFPSEFGLRAFPGKVFSISLASSYWSEYEKAILLYTVVKQEDGSWAGFAKGTVGELHKNIVRLKV